MSLRVVPVGWADVRAFINDWHRHHKPPPGHKLALGVANDNDVLVGVATLGRPVARCLQDGLTLEVTRTATDGTRNANSMLYGAAWRAAKALGYRRLITYTEADESGASLRAAGWRVIAERPPRRSWDTPARRRDASTYRPVSRTLWEASA